MTYQEFWQDRHSPTLSVLEFIEYERNDIEPYDCYLYSYVVLPQEHAHD